MKEREFQGYVLDVAARFGWRAWHVPMPVRPVAGGKFVPDPRGAGLPDLVLIHRDPPRLIFAELKKIGGKLSDEQHEFLSLARAVAEMAVALGVAPPAPYYAPISAGPVPAAQRAVGVYVWQPGMEDAIEAVLRSKVLMT